MPTHVLDDSYTLEDMAEAIRAAYAATLEPADEVDTITRSQLEEAMGWGQARALKALRALVKAGHLRPEMVWRTNIQGIRTRYMGYRWVTPPA